MLARRVKSEARASQTGGAREGRMTECKHEIKGAFESFE